MISTDEVVEEDPLTGVATKTLRRNAYFNLHGRYFHKAQGRHDDDCPLADGDAQATGLGDDLQDLAGDHRGARQERDDLEHDRLKAEYVDRMTAVDPGALLWTYHTVTDCRLLHGRHPPDPDQWRDVACRGRSQRRRARQTADRRQCLLRGQQPAVADTDYADYHSVRQLLLAKFPRDVVLGYDGGDTRRMTQRTLVRKILDAGFNTDPDHDFGG